MNTKTNENSTPSATNQGEFPNEVNPYEHVGAKLSLDLQVHPGFDGKIWVGICNAASPYVPRNDPQDSN